MNNGFKKIPISFDHPTVQAQIAVNVLDTDKDLPARDYAEELLMILGRYGLLDAIMECKVSYQD